MKRNSFYYNLPLWTLIAITYFSLSSCDPGQVIIIENQSGGDASMTLVLKPGPKHYVFEELAQSDTIHIELDTTAANSSRHFDFGIGHWEVIGAMDSLVSTVQKIDIQTPTVNKSFSTPQEISRFFRERIKGRMKEQIVVVLE